MRRRMGKGATERREGGRRGDKTHIREGSAPPSSDRRERERTHFPAKQKAYGGGGMERKEGGGEWTFVSLLVLFRPSLLLPFPPSPMCLSCLSFLSGGVRFVPPFLDGSTQCWPLHSLLAFWDVTSHVTSRQWRRRKPRDAEKRENPGGVMTTIGWPPREPRQMVPC